jgi:cytochrome c oxidase assembly protein subunit 15
MLLGAQGLLALLVVVLAAGTATTGAGPHAGDASGQEVAKRIPVALRQMAELHSSLALLLVGVTVGLVLALHALDVPERVRRAGRILVVVLVAQAAVGYTQYFTHLPALLVEVHIAGATALVVGFTQFFLALTHHPLEAWAADRQAARSAASPAAGRAPASAGLAAAGSAGSSISAVPPEGAPVGG